MTELPDVYGRESSLDARIRRAAFAFLEGEVLRRGEHLSRGVLAAGFQFEGRRVPLLGPQGIFKPAALQVPLSITTVPVEAGKSRPYDDEVGPDGLIRYRFRGTDPNHRDNAGLRQAMERRLPLVYFFGTVPGEYLAVWPVFVVAEDRQSLAFHVAVDAKDTAWEPDPPVPIASESRREYVTQITLRRLHQEAFRVRVIRAYQERCAVCRLRHEELLDAAHILPDGHPKGEPVVPNGLSLCKLHHAAFDRNILGIRPDLIVEIREDVLRERDGPMLLHGLQGFQDAKIVVPRHDALRPAPDHLAERYELFRKAG
jgi:putative restriction endonuclease